MTRTKQRGISLLALFALSGALAYFGLNGWQLNFVPAHYIGCLIAIFAVAGMFGINIWYGGPLDPRLDPEAAKADENAIPLAAYHEANPYAAPWSTATRRPSVQIIGIPPGEAPEDVRRCWVGLALPLAIEGPRSRLGYGVLTGPRGLGDMIRHFVAGKFVRQDGYIVDASVAVDILEAHAPHAAQWWRKNAPHAIRPGRRFIFAAEVCREVG
jgi:hypothetical protein